MRSATGRAPEAAGGGFGARRESTAGPAGVSLKVYRILLGIALGLVVLQFILPVEFRYPLFAASILIFVFAIGKRWPSRDR